MDLKYLEDTFKKVKDFYSIEDEVELLPDFKVKIKVFRDKALYDIILQFQAESIDYTSFLCKLFSRVVVKVNNMDIADIELSDSDMSVVEYLEQLAQNNLDINILEALYIVVVDYLTQLHKKALSTLKNESLELILKKAEKGYTNLGVPEVKGAEATAKESKTLTEDKK